ncbi:MAG: hypothetical protein QM790_01175 [Nibricoccus sp.]
MRMKTYGLFLATCFLFAADLCASLTVDINPATDRKDVLTEGYANWSVQEGTQVSKKFGEITVTLRPGRSGGNGLVPFMWKGGYDTGATVASDGVTVKDGDKNGSLEVVLSGLSAGRHALLTWHNTVAAKKISSFKVFVDGAEKIHQVQPTSRVENDEDAASTYVEFDAQQGRDVVIAFVPDGSGEINNIVLNGFALDVTNPDLQARRPFPANGDQHASENVILRWRPAKNATAHRVYFGASAEAVANATPESPECRGLFAQASFDTAEVAPNCMQDWFWRVDEIDAAKNVTKGDVWMFRPRHLAFPGAEGYGRFAIGGRGGRVIEVTNLNDSGPGSLREAVEAEGPRTVVFRVGGVINLKSKIVIRNPYITIAGQTAPGDGIAVHGYTLGCYGVHDVIIRYMRIRIGDRSGETMDGSGMGASTDHAIMDHCSIAWSIDEGFSSRGGKNFTLQRSIVAEALNMSVHSHYVGTGKGHSFAGSISGDVGSFHHNLIANCAGRNWSLAGGLDRRGLFSGWLDIRNNVVYNWSHRTNDGGVKALNLVGNYYIPGSASKVFHLLEPDFGTAKDPQQYFVDANKMEGKPQYDADNWSKGGVVLQEKPLRELKMSPEQVLQLIRLQKPFCEPYVTTQPAEQAYQSVVANVGANYPKYDSVDERVINDVRKRGFTVRGSKTGLPGIIDSQRDVGGYPQMKGGDAPPDSDHDGIPDAWETKHGLDPKNATDAAQVGAGGYTQLENYLNEIPLVK